MKITSVNVRKVDKEESKMKAYASVLLDDCFVIRDLKVIEGEKGLFVAMPSRKTPTGLFHDVVHPINQETRKMFEDAILEAYKNAE